MQDLEKTIEMAQKIKDTLKNLGVEKLTQRKDTCTSHKIMNEVYILIDEVNRLLEDADFTLNTVL